MSEMEKGRVLVAAALSIAVIFHSHVAEADIHKIVWYENSGASQTWTVSVNDSIDFEVGDYVNNVIQVMSKAAYDNCDASSGTIYPLKSVDFTQRGTFYFICSKPATACKQGGMKIVVTVV
ncbi:hypothetical protein CASFOL_035804 [Castilleja foliolosa]|uniref:Phytocyanin domain-containing protein n=1 Tax=Castilleja foliolosa TaxID=1961234 RepID=A0ABD3BUE0_9LAMI